MPIASRWIDYCRDAAIDGFVDLVVTIRGHGLDLFAAFNVNPKHSSAAATNTVHECDAVWFLFGPIQLSTSADPQPDP